MKREWVTAGIGTAICMASVLYCIMNYHAFSEKRQELAEINNELNRRCVRLELIRAYEKNFMKSFRQLRAQVKKKFKGGRKLKENDYAALSRAFEKELKAKRPGLGPNLYGRVFMPILDDLEKQIKDTQVYYASLYKWRILWDRYQSMQALLVKEDIDLYRRQ